MKLKTKNLLTLDELSTKEISSIVDLGIKLKKELKKGANKPILKNIPPRTVCVTNKVISEELKMGITNILLIQPIIVHPKLIWFSISMLSFFSVW